MSATTTSRISAPFPNGRPSTEATGPAKTDPLTLLAQLTPAEIAQAQRDLEVQFATAKERYVQRRKLLALLARGFGVRRERPAANTAREEANERIVALARSGAIGVDEIKAAGIPTQGIAKKLASLVKQGQLKRDRKGKYVAK